MLLDSEMLTPKLHIQPYRPIPPSGELERLLFEPGSLHFGIVLTGATLCYETKFCKFFLARVGLPAARRQAMFVDVNFWPTLLSVAPLVHYTVSSVGLSVVCNVLYCGETVRPVKNCLKE